MSVAITVPSVGESITEGTIARWLHRDGEAVRAQEPLFELETDKATAAVPAPASGTLRISTKEGETVAIGAVIGKIEPSGIAATSDGKKRAEPLTPPAQSAAPTPKGRLKEDIPPRDMKTAEPEDEVHLSPAVRRMVREEGIDVRQVKGTGRGGRIVKEDVVNFLEQSQQASPEVPPGAQPASTEVGKETRQRLSAIRQRIAQRLVASQQSTATLTTFNEADLSAVIALRARFKERFREKHGAALGFMPFFVKACVSALKEFPVVNSRIEGDEIVTPRYYHISIAVTTEKGLMVPVLRDADRLSFAAIERAITELAEKARAGSISVGDLQGGTFTITNGGIFGSLLSTPVLNPPQSAILGMHTIQRRPIAVDDQVVVRPMMYLALSYDHRLIDGREAVLFLVRVKECIENPERMLLEV
jgi:2-oxoglutarate dehydrogenase E2 component (dihydrolipoamide succinyltransferase)